MSTSINWAIPPHGDHPPGQQLAGHSQQSAGLIWLSPLTFVSSAFVPERSMQTLLRILAEWNPVTAVINATRDLFGNANPAGVQRMTGWPAEHAALYSVFCSLVIIAIFVPLSLRAYRRVAAR